MFSLSHKTFILEQLSKSFEDDLQTLVSSAESAHEAATHAESRADNKYDTRGLEASYLAGAQAARAQEIRKLLGICQTFKAKAFSSSDEIAIGAIVEIENETAKQLLFLVPFAGGRSVTVEGKKINIVSSASPLGDELIGRKQGDAFEVEMRGRQVDYEILSVS
ncbi:MAG: GreA/GreB family elongation factor [Bdellovibrionota bacterium]